MRHPLESRTQYTDHPFLFVLDFMVYM
nr:unnamed protein product [Callosobruchus chinensis]